MSELSQRANLIRRRAEKSPLRHHASSVIEFLARAGYAAKGAVYIIVGGLAILAAFGTSNGQTTGTRGALHTLLDKPAGVVLVAILAAGLAGYALWCLIQGIFDPDREGTHPKALTKRTGRFFKGLAHVLLVVAAIAMVTGRDRSTGGQDESNIERWTAKLMSLPLGIWLVGIVGACVVGYGLWNVYRAWKIKLDDMLDMSRMNPRARRTAIHISRFGIAARGAVFAVIGAALIVAALRANPHEAKGVGGALQTLANQPYGPWLLALAATGLIAYGLYEFLRARYRIIRPTNRR